MSWQPTAALALSCPVIPKIFPEKTQACLFPPDSTGKVAVISEKYRTYLLYSITVDLLVNIQRKYP